MRFAFGDHLLDADRRELRRRGEPVALEPQVFDLLLYLLANRDRVVSRDDLIGHVWRGRIVSDSALTTRLNAARTAVGDSGAAQQVIRTIARKGVRFVADVAEEGAPKAIPAPGEPVLALPDKPSIAVLPFQNMSGDPDQEYFADGTVEEIITALSRIRWLFVIARNSSFTYKGQAVDVKRVGRELGVRYVLEGSIRKGGNRVRIAAQLIEAQAGTHLWAEHFDGSLEDLFDLQDQVATSVAGIIEPTLQAAETHRSAQYPTKDLTAYDLYLRALPFFYTFAQEGITKALQLLKQAIARDPEYGPALGLASICHERSRQDGWSTAPEDDLRQAVDLARRALHASPGDPGVLANAAFVLSWAGEEIEAMIAIMDRALVLNPSYARGWYLSALVRSQAGDADAVIEHVERAMRLSPRERSGPFVVARGVGYFLKRDFEAAIAALVSVIQEYPGFPASYRLLAASYAHLGRLDEARSTLDRLRTITPLIMPLHLSAYRKTADRELYLSGMRLAMGESE